MMDLMQWYNFLTHLVFVGSERGAEGKPAKLFLFPILRVSYLLIYVCLVFIVFFVFCTDYYVLCAFYDVTGCVTYVLKGREKNCCIDDFRLRVIRWEDLSSYAWSTPHLSVFLLIHEHFC